MVGKVPGPMQYTLFSMLLFFLLCLPPALDCRGGGGYIAQGGDVYHTSSSPYRVNQPSSSSSPTHTVVWRAGLGGVVFQPPLTSYPMYPNGSVIPASAPLLASTPTLPIQAFVVGNDGTLSALRCSDGALLWRFSPGRATLKSSPLVTPFGTLLLPSQDSMGGGRLSSVSAVNGGGAPKWVFQGGGGLGGVAILPSPLDTPVVAGDDGRLYGVNPNTGAVAWKTVIGYGGTTLSSTPTVIAGTTTTTTTTSSTASHPTLLLLGTTTGTLLFFNTSGGLVLTVVAGVSGGGGSSVPPTPGSPFYDSTSTLTPVMQVDERGTHFIVWWGCDGSLYRVSYLAILQQGFAASSSGGDVGGGGGGGGSGGGGGGLSTPLLYIPNSPLDPGIPLALIAGATVFDAAAVSLERDLFLSSICDCPALSPITVWPSPPFSSATVPYSSTSTLPSIPPFAVHPKVGGVAIFSSSVGGMVYLNPLDFSVAWVWGGPSSSPSSSSSNSPSMACSPPLFDAGVSLLFSCSNAMLYALAARGNTSTISFLPDLTANATTASTTPSVGAGLLLWSVSLGEASTGVAPPTPTLGGDGVILAPTCDGSLVGIVSDMGDLSALGGPLPSVNNAPQSANTSPLILPLVVSAFVILLVVAASLLCCFHARRKPVGGKEEEGQEEDIEASGATASTAPPATAVPSSGEDDPLSLTLKAIRAASALTMKELSLERPPGSADGSATTHAAAATNNPTSTRMALKKEGAWWGWVAAILGQPFHTPPPPPKPLLSSPRRPASPPPQRLAPSNPTSPTNPRVSSPPRSSSYPSPRSPAEAFQAMLSRSTEEERNGRSTGSGGVGGTTRGASASGKKEGKGWEGGGKEGDFRDSLWRDALGGAFTTLSPPAPPPPSQPPQKKVAPPPRSAAAAAAAAATTAASISASPAFSTEVSTAATSVSTNKVVQRSAENVARAERKKAAAAAAAAAHAEEAAKEAAAALKATKRRTPLPSFVSINPLLGGMGVGVGAANASATAATHRG